MPTDQRPPRNRRIALYTGKSILDVANENNFAIPAFNISDWAMFNGIMDISEEKAAPVIIAIHPDEVSHITTDLIAAMHSRAHRSSVPVAIHWDHGGSYEQIITAIKAGFTSVMIDASLLPFDENVALTRKVVDAAHAVGIQVEGELGTIGANDSYGESGAAEIIYTNPADAVRFVEETGVDSLAIAIGTSHGLYPSDKNPELRHDLLEEIKAAIGIPPVLHGGSSNLTPNCVVRSNWASTRSTSPATSRSRTTTACARCSAPTSVCASRTRSSRRRSKP